MLEKWTPSISDGIDCAAPILAGSYCYMGNRCLVVGSVLSAEDSGMYVKRARRESVCKLLRHKAEVIPECLNVEVITDQVGLEAWRERQEGVGKESKTERGADRIERIQSKR